MSEKISHSIKRIDRCLTKFYAEKAGLSVGEWLSHLENIEIAAIGMDSDCPDDEFKESLAIVKSVMDIMPKDFESSWFYGDEKFYDILIKKEQLNEKYFEKARQLIKKE